MCEMNQVKEPEHQQHDKDGPDVPKSWHFRRVLAQVPAQFFTFNTSNSFSFDAAIHLFSPLPRWLCELSQFLATTVENLILFEIGLQIAVSAIIIPALTGLTNEFNRNETLSLTPSQASWLSEFVISLLSSWNR